VYEVADTPIYSNKIKCGLLVSEPFNYFATLTAINLGMALVYGFSSNLEYEPLFSLTVICHVLTMVWLLLLALVDPGIIPKVLTGYEFPDLQKIPLPQSYIDGSIRDRDHLSYNCTVKTHFEKLRFC
jgi:hypothetical protein